MPETCSPDPAVKESVHTLYKAGSARRLALIAGLSALVIVTAILSAGIGTVAITPQDTVLAIGHSCAVSLQDFLHTHLPAVAAWYDAVPFTIPAPQNPQAELIVVGFRLPRIFLAILTGISLAGAGAVMQGLLRNPLVSPFTLGLSSAASFGAALAIVIGPGVLVSYFLLSYDMWIVVFAFVFGWLSMLLVYWISQSRGTTQSTLILAGVVIGYLFTAGVMALKYLTNNEKLRELMVWLMGGMWGASWNAVLLLIPLVIVCFFLLERRAWDLNALSAGDDVAKNLGINVERLRLSGLMISTFAASCCLAFTGIIGFVGLMGPHICRMIIGSDHRYLIPCAGLMGAAILLLSDTVARTIMSPVEIPVGIIMYAIGGVFFLFLIMRGKGRGLY
ncbi:FecCD family ABC transporter permease [Methanoregula formicica]|uniref:Cobalamin import system permease protein BtuC n=1 Tax=Methanoregula formicica (strain DSM 22288 / NBRC 105244 / SMSP) TaxID=593750 RepID=L0HAX5_METFS|nr:iron ABC transporter permease [Methanoregula formicica]AGB01902.1 ABC-type Fe3+-siderophore transport system, permease component [Methanoregula formicica SMSP]